MNGNTFRFVLLSDSLSVLGTLTDKVEEEDELGDTDDPGCVVYRIRIGKEQDRRGLEQMRQLLESLERLGHIKIIRDESMVSVIDIKNADDILKATTRVQILKGNPLKLRVFIGAEYFELEHRELLGPSALMLRMIGFGKVVRIKDVEWSLLLQEWLDIAETIDEINVNDEVREEVFRYLEGCTIYRDIFQAVGHRSLYYDPAKPDVVFCRTEAIYGAIALKEMGDLNARKVRWILTDFIEGASHQIRVASERRRFWAFKIRECGIDLQGQMYEGEEEVAGDKEMLHDTIIALTKQYQEQDDVRKGAMIEALKARIFQKKIWQKEDIDVGIERLIEGGILHKFNYGNEGEFVRINES